MKTLGERSKVQEIHSAWLQKFREANSWRKKPLELTTLDLPMPEFLDIFLRTVRHFLDDLTYHNLRVQLLISGTTSIALATLLHLVKYFHGNEIIFIYWNQLYYSKWRFLLSKSETSKQSPCGTWRNPPRCANLLSQQSQKESFW